jgi:monovalent cation/hydrogen antiporter
MRGGSSGRTRLGQDARVHELAVLGIVLLAVVVAGICRRYDVAAPLPLVLVGLLVGLVTVSRGFDLKPELALTLALPPLLFSAALESSYVAIRANRRPILLLSVGLVLFTAVAVALAARWVIPDLPLGAAFALGAVLGPTDAVAASAVASRLGLPRRSLTILEGESLVNDGTGLTVFRVAVTAAVATSFSWADSLGIFALAVVGGIALGWLGGEVLRQALRRLQDPLLENAIILLAPFALYLGAEEVHASGFLAVVVAGLMVSHTQSTDLGYATRLQATAVWEVATYLLESLAFTVVGLELPHLWHTVAHPLAGQANPLSGGRVALATVAVFVAVVLSRLVWVFPGTYLPRVFVRKIRESEPMPTPRSVLVVAWAGIRGPVSLLAVLGLPLTVHGGNAFPRRDVLILITSVVVLATLVIQGLTLGPLVKWLLPSGELTERENRQDHLAEAEAQHHAAQAALARLDEELETGPAVDDAVVQRLRDYAEHRSNSAWEVLGGPAERPAEAYRRLRLSMLEAEREVFLDYRERGRLPDHVLRRVFRDLDLEQANLEQ